jgi:hypothetical protein
VPAAAGAPVGAVPLDGAGTLGLGGDAGDPTGADGGAAAVGGDGCTAVGGAAGVGVEAAPGLAGAFVAGGACLKIGCGAVSWALAVAATSRSALAKIESAIDKNRPRAAEPYVRNLM